MLPAEAGDDVAGPDGGRQRHRALGLRHRAGQEDQGDADLPDEHAAATSTRCCGCSTRCQLTAKHKVATPVNWKQGDDVIIVPAVSDAEAKQTYPQGWKIAEAVHPDRRRSPGSPAPAASSAGRARTARALPPAAYGGPSRPLADRRGRARADPREEQLRGTAPASTVIATRQFGGRFSCGRTMLRPVGPPTRPASPAPRLPRRRGNASKPDQRGIQRDSTARRVVEREGLRPAPVLAEREQVVGEVVDEPRDRRAAARQRQRRGPRGGASPGGWRPEGRARAAAPIGRPPPPPRGRRGN